MSKISYIKLVSLSAVLVLWGCDTSQTDEVLNSQAERVNSVTFEDGSSSSGRLYVTGRDYADSHSFWQCRLSEAPTSEVPIRIWDNGTGALNVESFTWASTDADTLVLMFPDKKVTLTEVKASQSAMTALTASGEGVDCNWAGQARASITAPLFEDSLDENPVELVLDFQARSASALSCIHNEIGESSIGFTLEFLDSSIARLEEKAWEWRVDESNNLVFTSGNKYRVWHNVSIFEDAAGSKLLALEKGNSIDCAAASGTAL